MSESSSFTTVDWMAAIIERYWLVVGCSVIFGGAWAFMQLTVPPAYVSTALLGLKAEQAAEAESIMRSPVVLDSIVNNFPAVRAETPEASRRNLSSQIEWSTSPSQRKLKPTLFHLDVKSQDPSRAQQIANSLIDQWLELTKPRPVTRARLEVEISRLEQQLKQTTTLIEKLQSEATTLVVPNSMQGELAGPMVKILAEREELAIRLTERRVEFSGLSREIVVSPPTLPVENVIRLNLLRGTLISGMIGAVVGAFLALLLEWFGRSKAAISALSGTARTRGA